VLTFVYGTNGQLTKITKGATEWKYATTIVNGHNLLTGYTNPTNQTTSYHYDAGALPGTWDKLDRVTDTAGQIFRLTYGPQGDWSQVTQVTQDFPDARPDNITKFDYKPVSTLGHACTTPVANSPYPNNVVFDRTVETDNAGRVTTYCYNTSGQVIQSWRPWDTTAPTATPSGAWFDLHEWYSNGVAAQSVTLSATDAVSGVKRVALEEIGKPETAASIASCPPTTTMPNLCPASYSATVTVNPAVLAEGAHSFRQTASDMAGNVGVSTPWIVSIDRTGPGFAAGFSTSASLDPASGTAVIDWDGAADPALPDGSVGSGLAGYTVRTRPAGGAWSAWVPTKLEQALVGGSISGRVYNVEVQPSDQVGNLGAVKAFDVTVTGSGSVCQATANGYPPGCSDDPGGEDTTEPEPAQLVQSTSAGSGSPQTLTAAYRYTVHIGGGGWKTIRRWHNSYVIGNVHDGWQFDQVRQDYTDDVGWITGKIYGQFNACGWIQAEPQTGEGVETACPTHLKIDLERFADGVNCASCNRGTPIQVIRPYPQCRNVSPPPTDNVPTTCLDAITTRTTDQAVTDGYQVAWRYVTNDNRFVLVDDTNVAEGDKSNGFWVFMDRRAFRTPSLCTRNAVKKYDCGAP
jgi:YD repeat-containing protein